MRRALKKLAACAALLLALASLLNSFSFPSYADENWDETIYRAYGEEGQLIQEEIVALDEAACEFVKKWEIDMVLAVTNSDGYTGDFERAAKDFYLNNGFGYGEDRSGVIACYEEDKDILVIRTFGRAQEMLPQEFIDENEAYLPKFHINHGDFGVLYAFSLVAEDWLEAANGESAAEKAAKLETEAKAIEAQLETAESGAGSSLKTSESGAGSSLKTSEDSAEFNFERDSFGLPYRNIQADKPSWYPKDVESFKEYHDSEAPRVVDKADIFSDEEETAMLENIREVAAETNKDVVIFTDTSTYGFDRETYCYDFYDFCGYGYGDTYDGMCLFICMDPDNRGWVASATGIVEDMYTEAIANDMDDVLYEYMVAGDYGEGVIDWIGNVYNLYTKGKPFVPEWLPLGDEKEAFVRSNNSDISRVYDSAQVLAEGDRDLLFNLADNVSKQYGIDVVVHTTRRTYDMSDEEYADSFYKYNGYGFGDNYDGILLTMVVGQYGKRAVITGYGAGLDRMNKTNHDRMVSQSQSDVEGGYYYLAAYKFIKNVDHMEKTGRVNYTLWGWLIRLIIACIAGAIVGAIALSRAKGKMETVRAAFNADSYLDGTNSIIPVEDAYIDEQVTRRKIVVQSSSSTRSYSSSSGRSTYHSHSSGSSGRSHTSSSRSF